jgi:hypothetical protein
MQTSVPPGTVAGESRVAVIPERVGKPVAQGRRRAGLAAPAAALPTPVAPAAAPRTPRPQYMDLPSRQADITVLGARAPNI